MTDEKQVRQIVREELDEQGRMTRRGVLGLLGSGAVAGALTGSASGAAQTDGNLSLADVTADTYRIAGDRYGGPASARSQLESELGNSDAGAKYLGEDNGALYHWTGSNWELMQSTSAAVNTDALNTTSREPDIIIRSDGDGGFVADGPDSELATADDVAQTFRDARDATSLSDAVYRLKGGPHTVSSYENVDTDTYVAFPLNSGEELRGGSLVRQDNQSDLGEWVNVVGNADPSNGDEDITVRNVTIDGNRSNQTTTGRQWEAINFKNVTDGWVIGADIENAVTDGIDFDNCEDSWMLDSSVSNAGGKSFHPSGGCRSVTVSHCQSTGAGTEGFGNVSGAHNTRFIACISDEDTIGARIDANGTKGNGIELIGITIKNPVDHALATKQTAGYVTITGGQIIRENTPSANDQHLINFEHGSGDPHVTIDGPYIVGAGSVGQELINNAPDDTVVKNCTIESANMTTLACATGAVDVSVKNNEITIASVTPIEADGATVHVEGNSYDADSVSRPYVTNPASGSIVGGTGREAAGAGNPPTAADWEEGRLVENTDDNTLYVKTSDGTMTAI